MSFMMSFALLTQRVLGRCSSDGSSMPLSALCCSHNMLEGVFVSFGAAAVPVIQFVGSLSMMHL